MLQRVCSPDGATIPLLFPSPLDYLVVVVSIDGWGETLWARSRTVEAAIL